MYNRFKLYYYLNRYIKRNVFLRRNKIDNEKRRAKRLNISDIGGLTVFLNNRLKVKPLNISRSGMAIQCGSIKDKVDVKKDNLVFIRIQYINGNIDVEVMAKIIWNIFDTVGLQFNDVSPENQKAIDDFIKITRNL